MTHNVKSVLREFFLFFGQMRWLPKQRVALQVMAHTKMRQNLNHYPIIRFIVTKKGILVKKNVQDIFNRKRVAF